MPTGKGKTQSFNVTLPPELAKHYDDKKKELGSGGFARVILAEHIATREKVAIKVMNKRYLAKKDDLHRAYNEIYALKSLIHQHICQLYQVYETEEYIYLVIEYCPGGELFDYIVSKKRLPEKEARHVFRQIISAVAYIHKNGYAHRDLKPENMLLDWNKKIKIIDFGLSAKPEKGLKSPLYTRAGSALYASPELISGVPYFGNETDVWSLGVVLYALLCGFLPFDHEVTAELYKKIKKGVFAIPPWLSAKSLRLLQDMLQVNTNKRISVKNIIRHEWTVFGIDEPLQWESTFQPNNLNRTAVLLLSEYYQWTVADTERRIQKLRYDHLTSFYFLLCKMSDTKLRKFKNTWLQRTKFLDEKIMNNLLVPREKSEVNGHVKITDDVEQSRERSNTLDSPNINERWSSESKKNETSLPYSSHRRRSRTMDAIKNELQSSKVIQETIKIIDGNKERSNTLGYHIDPLIVITDHKTQHSQTVTRNNFNPNDVKNPTFVPLKRDGGSSNLHTTKRYAASCNDGLNGVTLDNKRQVSNLSYVQSKCDSIDPTVKLREEKRPRTKSMKEFKNRLSGLFKQVNGPRRVKAIYHVENTSTLPAEDIRIELDRVLTLLVSKSLLTSFSSPDSYLFKCKCKTGNDKKTVFELEICMIPFMDNVVGIRRKRLKGDAWKYKELVEQILTLARI